MTKKKLPGSSGRKKPKIRLLPPDGDSADAAPEHDLEPLDLGGLGGAIEATDTERGDVSDPGGAVEREAGRAIEATRVERVDVPGPGGAVEREAGRAIELTDTESEPAPMEPDAPDVPLDDGADESAIDTDPDLPEAVDEDTAPPARRSRWGRRSKTKHSGVDDAVIEDGEGAGAYDTDPEFVPGPIDFADPLTLPLPAMTSATSAPDQSGIIDDVDPQNMVSDAPEFDDQATETPSDDEIAPPERPLVVMQTVESDVVRRRGRPSGDDHDTDEHDDAVEDDEAVEYDDAVEYEDADVPTIRVQADPIGGLDATGAPVDDDAIDQDLTEEDLRDEASSVESSVPDSDDDVAEIDDGAPVIKVEADPVAISESSAPVASEARAAPRGHPGSAPEVAPFDPEEDLAQYADEVEHDDGGVAGSPRWGVAGSARSQEEQPETARGLLAFLEHSPTITRIVTGVLFAAAVIAIILIFGRPGLATLTIIVITWMAVEYYGAQYQALVEDEEELENAAPVDTSERGVALIGRPPSSPPAALVGVAATFLMALLAYLSGIEAFGVVAAFGIVGSVMWFLGAQHRGEAPLEAVMSLAGVIHVGVLGSFALLILADPHGMAILSVIVILVISADVGAYAVGRIAGSRPLAPSVSPNKSVEGLVGGIATVFVVAIVVKFLEPIYQVVFLGKFGNVLVLAAVVGAFGFVGDLSESVIKRGLGIKDMGSFLPGHGGMFDRFDALLFVLPAAYVALRALGVDA